MFCLTGPKTGSESRNELQPPDHLLLSTAFAEGHPETMFKKCIYPSFNLVPPLLPFHSPEPLEILRVDESAAFNAGWPFRSIFVLCIFLLPFVNYISPRRDLTCSI
jgi:hypothetical protein